MQGISYQLIIAPTKGRTGEVTEHLFCPEQISSFLDWARVNCEWKNLRSGDSLTIPYGRGGGMAITIHRDANTDHMGRP